jgi:DNA-binding transcriptional LysR family regulator
LGHQLLPQAVALLDQAKEIEDLLNGKSGFGSLAVGATLTIGNYLATLLIGSFMQTHPESQVNCTQNTAHIVQQVAHYEIDLGLIEGDCNHPDLEVQPWVEDELVVFCAPQHPLAKLGRADIEQLPHEAWILREQGSGTRLTFDQAMRHHRANLNIRLSWSTPKRSSARWSRAWASVAFHAWPCATPSAAAAWHLWKHRSWTCCASSTSSGTNRSTRPRPCVSFSSYAAASLRALPQ